MLLADSSAIVKFFSKEPGWEALRSYIGEAITVPLALVELGNALLVKSNKNEITEEIALELLNYYSKNAILLNEKKYFSSAFELAFKNKITFYDSLFIAASLGEGYDLLSCDQKQIKIAEKLGIKVIRG